MPEFLYSIYTCAYLFYSEAAHTLQSNKNQQGCLIGTTMMKAHSGCQRHSKITL